MICDIVQLLGPVLAGFGIVLSVWGTYLLTRWYHPFDAPGFLRTAIRVVALMLKGNVATVFREADVATKLGALNREEKSESLVGLYFIFVGFILQAVGTLFWAIDAVRDIVQRHAACP